MNKSWICKHIVTTFFGNVVMAMLCKAHNFKITEEMDTSGSCGENEEIVTHFILLVGCCQVDGSLLCKINLTLIDWRNVNISQYCIGSSGLHSSF